MFTIHLIQEGVIFIIFLFSCFLCFYFYDYDLWIITICCDYYMFYMLNFSSSDMHHCINSFVTMRKKTKRKKRLTSDNIYRSISYSNFSTFKCVLNDFVRLFTHAHNNNKKLKQKPEWLLIFSFLLAKNNLIRKKMIIKLINRPVKKQKQKKIPLLTILSLFSKK